ncbi:MAG: hypothetical protein ACLF0G_15790 [Candidatus Brocadiia bacterium]
MSHEPQEKAPARRPWARLAADPRVQAALLVLALALAALVGASFARRGQGPTEGRTAARPSPQIDPIVDSWRAAERGDVAAYLECFAGQARHRLEAQVEERGREAFAQGLRRRAEAATVSFRPATRLDGDHATFVVGIERDGEVETLDYVVERGGEEWKIREVVSRGPSRVPSHDERLGPQGGKGEAP